MLIYMLRQTRIGYFNFKHLSMGVERSAFVSRPRPFALSSCPSCKSPLGLFHSGDYFRVQSQVKHCQDSFRVPISLKGRDWAIYWVVRGFSIGREKKSGGCWKRLMWVTDWRIIQVMSHGQRKSDEIFWASRLYSRCVLPSGGSFCGNN